MIDLENVSKTYSTGVPALEDINLHIDKGEFVFITGVSGSGKSTLIKLLLKELNPTSGRIVINGRNLSGIKPNKLPYLRRDIGVVFQDFRLFEDRNVYENVAFAQKAIEAPGKRIRAKVLAMLSMAAIITKTPSWRCGSLIRRPASRLITTQLGMTSSGMSSRRGAASTSARVRLFCIP